MRTVTRLLLAALAVTAAGCGDQPGVTPQSPAGTWRQMAPAPIPGRFSAVAVRVGPEVLFLGGIDDAGCPPNADCAYRSVPRRDGAAYAPSTDTWRRMAPAPVPVEGADTAVIGDVVYLLMRTDPEPRAAEAFVAYDVSDDAWRTLPSPPAGYRALVAAGDDVVAYLGSHENDVPRGDFRFDASTQRWSRLPDDPLEPSFDRTMTWTGDRLVLIAPKLVPSPGGSDGPSWLRAATYDPVTDRWTRLPETRQVIGGYQFPVWDGSRLLNPAPEYYDGGRVNSYGRRLPTGGWLDVSTGEWEVLPRHDHEWHRGWGVTAASPTYSVVGSSVLDAVRKRWLVLDPPPRAPEQGSSAIWVDDELVVWGGAGFASGGSAELYAHGAVWRPPAG